MKIQLNKTQKIIGFSLLGVLGVSFSYWLYNYLRLMKAYSSVATIAQANNDIANPNTPLLELPDPALQDAINKAASEDGYTNDGNDNLMDTVTINGINYNLEDNGTYTSEDGGLIFNPITSTITASDGTVTKIEPSSIKYSESGNP
jgi:hypothetical protein